MQTLYFVLALLLCDIISSSNLKSYHLSGYTNTWNIVFALAAYIAVPFLLLFSLKYEGIGNMNLYWNVISTICVYLIAVYFFGESVTHTQFVGILLALLGIFLIIISGKKNN